MYNFHSDVIQILLYIQVDLYGVDNLPANTLVPYITVSYLLANDATQQRWLEWSACFLKNFTSTALLTAFVHTSFIYRLHSGAVIYADRKMVFPSLLLFFVVLVTTTDSFSLSCMRDGHIGFKLLRYTLGYLFSWKKVLSLFSFLSSFILLPFLVSGLVVSTLCCEAEGGGFDSRTHHLLCCQCLYIGFQTVWYGSISGIPSPGPQMLGQKVEWLSLVP